MTTSLELVERWRAGDESAARLLHERYVAALTAIVGQNLAARFSKRFDPDDVLQSAFRSWFHRTRSGAFEFDEDEDVWKLLVTVTLNKVRNRVRNEQAGLRDINAEAASSFPFDSFVARRLAGAPSPVEQVEFADLLNAVLEQLSERDREIFRLRIEGNLHRDIAEELGITTKTVHRALNKIPPILEKIMESESN